MIDDNKEDEYQFTELDGDHSFDEDVSMDEVKTSFPSDNNLRKIILSGFAVIVVGFILFKFISSYFASKDNLGSKDLTEKTAPKPSVAVVQKPVIEQPKPAAPKPAALPPKPVMYEPKVSAPTFQSPQATKIVTKTINDPRIDGKLDELKRNSQNSSRKILRINNNVASIRDSIEALSSKIGSLNVIIGDLSATVKEQQRQLDALKPKPKEEKSAKKVKKAEKITYHVKALIPGRGWLMSSQGVTVTVVEGTHLPGYGRVESIDARHGKVTMDSGTVITFSVSDT